MLLHFLTPASASWAFCLVFSYIGVCSYNVSNSHLHSSYLSFWMFMILSCFASFCVFAVLIDRAFLPEYHSVHRLDLFLVFFCSLWFSRSVLNDLCVKAHYLFQRPINVRTKSLLLNTGKICPSDSSGLLCDTWTSFFFFKLGSLRLAKFRFSCLSYSTLHPFSIFPIFQRTVLHDVVFCRTLFGFILSKLPGRNIVCCIISFTSYQSLFKDL